MSEQTPRPPEGQEPETGQAPSPEQPSADGSQTEVSAAAPVGNADQPAEETTGADQPSAADQAAAGAEPSSPEPSLESTESVDTDVVPETQPETDDDSPLAPASPGVHSVTAALPVINAARAQRRNAAGNGGNGSPSSAAPASAGGSTTSTQAPANQATGTTGPTSPPPPPAASQGLGRSRRWVTRGAIWGGIIAVLVVSFFLAKSTFFGQRDESDNQAAPPAAQLTNPDRSGAPAPASVPVAAQAVTDPSPVAPSSPVAPPVQTVVPGGSGVVQLQAAGAQVNIPIGYQLDEYYYPRSGMRVERVDIGSVATSRQALATQLQTSLSFDGGMTLVRPSDAGGMIARPEMVAVDLSSQVDQNTEAINSLRADVDELSGTVNGLCDGQQVMLEILTRLAPAPEPE